MADIFISYAREDLETAQRLAQALGACGWSVWWDRRIPTGRRFHEVIERELTAAGCVIPLWSKSAVASSWVREEAQDGLDRGVIVPAMIEAVPLPLGFRTVQTADLSRWQNDGDEAGFAQLVEDIEALIGPAPKRLADELRRTAEDARRRAEEEERQRAEAEAGRKAEEERQGAAAEENPLDIFRTTATYEGFKSKNIPDQYALKVYVGTFAGPKTADGSARKEIAIFMKNKGYSSYEITNRRYNFIPSYYEYTIQFKREY